MDRSNRRGWSALPLRLLLLVCLFVFPGATAHEPEGDFRLRVERVPSSNGSLVVRLKIRPFVAVDEPELTVSAPLEFDLRPRTPSMHRRLEFLEVPGGQTSLRAELHPLVSEQPSTVELELIVPPGAYGTFDFVVEGRDGTGRAIRDAIGLLVPDPARLGVRRLGAVEFPAIVLPAEAAR